jgi:hypothetical protein
MGTVKEKLQGLEFAMHKQHYLEQVHFYLASPPLVFSGLLPSRFTQTVAARPSVPPRVRSSVTMDEILTSPASNARYSWIDAKCSKRSII